MEKECTICHKIKDVSEFYQRNDRHTRDGFTYSCKECERKRKKDYREKNPISYREMSRKSNRKFYATWGNTKYLDICPKCGGQKHKQSSQCKSCYTATDLRDRLKEYNDKRSGRYQEYQELGLIN